MLKLTAATMEMFSSLGCFASQNLLGHPDTLTKRCSILASISLRCLKVISPFWTTTSLRCCDLSPTNNRSGVHSIRAIHGCHLANRIRLEPNNFEVVSPIDAPHSRRLVVSSCRLSLSRCASWLSRHHLSSSSCCTALSSSHHAGWLLRCLSLCRPLVLSM